MFKSKAKQKHPETMEETFSLILDGCKLAKDLESNLGNLANQPQILYKSCDDIIKVFATAKQRLNDQDPALLSNLLAREPLKYSSSQQQLQTDPSLQEWLKYGVISQAMEMIQHQPVPAGKTTPLIEINEMGGKKLLEGSLASARLKGIVGVGGEIQAPDVLDSGRGSSSSSQRPRRRKDAEEKCTMTVPAPQMGNTDLPPEDNYTWRKYGQKEILGSRYPRAYYRCTHQKMYNCPAKKQVQRLDNDFYTFELTYIGQHTCHMSSTAPSIPPPPPLDMTQDQIMTQAMVTQPTPTSSSSVPLGRWLSMEFGLGSGGSGSGSAAAGGSTTGGRYGRDVDYPAVADMADVMFNSGSSSSNSMDFIFPCADDKWEAGAGDKKN
ncbi:WRKY transcription factor 55-like isoform X2 [Durio zibethinus]|uniref:WRKY transcription factor 55-like isoform X2 n=1 Tax=Durio zibethinus TaxID=66656 RepID=A0A6P6AHT9_DURZI|nr:WRKY transcription factor 55-like isoform X2 [Durio zibethinus]